MNLNRKVEAYCLLKDGENYRILNLDYENTHKSDKMIVKKEKVIKKICKKQNKKNTKDLSTEFQQFVDFVNLNSKLKFRGNMNNNCFSLNSFEFKNLHNICKILFHNGKKIENIELLKLRKIFKIFNKKQLKKLSENVKKMLSK